jgi:hypothetical protein
MFLYKCQQDYLLLKKLNDKIQINIIIIIKIYYFKYKRILRVILFSYKYKILH